MRERKGFSLIELLIVVAIILIIAAIAIPSLLRSRIAANDSATASSLRTLNSAEITYLNSYPQTGFSVSLQHLGPNGANCTNAVSVTSTSACLIDSVLGCSKSGPCKKGGFKYYLTSSGVVPVMDYVLSAGPESMGYSGDKNYCSVPDAVIRQTTPGVAPPVLGAPETNANCVDPAQYVPIQ
jgi:type IV pilus assembly protein PilA